MKSWLSILVLAVLVVAVPGPRGYGDEPKVMETLMRKKLQHSQKVLEAIALNDFKAIAEHGEELMLLSKQTEWRVLKTPPYELYTDDFRRAVDTMIDKAKEKNLDGATLAYVNMTMSCVRCHKYVREARKV